MTGKLVILPILGLIATGCGEPTENVRSGGGSSDRVDTLEIEVRPDAQTEPLTATLRCGTAPEATGFVNDAERACAAAWKSKQLLIHGPPDNVFCTEIYGGPQQARITGTVDGEPVDLTVTREDGCAIALWDELEDLIGPPPNA